MQEHLNFKSIALMLLIYLLGIGTGAALAELTADPVVVPPLPISSTNPNQARHQLPVVNIVPVNPADSEAPGAIDPLDFAPAVEGDLPTLPNDGKLEAPPFAIAACQNLVEGNTCTVGEGDTSLVGTCQTVATDLACMPDLPEPPAGSPKPAAQ